MALPEQTTGNFKKIFEKLEELVPLLKEKDQRNLDAARALVPDHQGRTNFYVIHIFMPDGLPVLEAMQFHVEVLAEIEKMSALDET